MKVANMQRNHDIVEIAAEKRRETEKAIALFDGRMDKEGKEKWEWVPKSQVEDNGDGTFSMPEWLAADKGFL